MTKNYKKEEEKMFEAVLNCDKLQAKNLEELFKELHEHYDFNTLAELDEILKSLNIKLIIRIN